MHSLPWLQPGVCVRWVHWLQENALVFPRGCFGGDVVQPLMGCSQMTWASGCCIFVPELSLSQQCDLGCSSTLWSLPRGLDVISITSLRVFAVGHVSYRHFRELVPPSLGHSLCSRKWCSFKPRGMFFCKVFACSRWTVGSANLWLQPRLWFRPLPWIWRLYLLLVVS